MLSYKTSLQVPEGEGNISFARHNSSLQAEAEAKTKNPKCSVVSELMKISFALGGKALLKSQSH